MRLDALLYFYGRWLRTHPGQELFAGFGIAIGVALALSVLIANSSIGGSATEVVRGMVGTTDVQLTARDSRGFDERILRSVRAIPGVEKTAPVMEQRAVVIGPDGREAAVNLAGFDSRLAGLSGRLAGNFVIGGMANLRGILLPQATARAIGLPDPSVGAVIDPLPSVTVEVRGRAVRSKPAAVLGRETLGPVADALVTLMPLRALQALTGLEGRLSRVLVVLEPDAKNSTLASLRLLAKQHDLDLRPAMSDADLIDQALEPSEQATTFFAVMSAMLGFLLAFNAMLLTAPERRRVIAELRIQGFRPHQLALMLMFQAAVLGTVGSIVGVVAGDALSRNVFAESPDYLAPAFTLGTHTTIGPWPIVIALVGGIAACCLAAAPPLLDLRRDRAVDAVFQTPGAPGNALSRRTTVRLLVAAGGCFAAATALLLALPALALVACALLAVATVLALPAAFAGVLALAGRVSSGVPRLNMLGMALLSLRSTTLRSLALAATGAVAVFGSVAIGGARQDLLRGIGDYARDYVSTADLWIVNGQDNQATNDFVADDLLGRVASVPGVAAVRGYQGGFLNVDGRRVWVIARDPRDSAMIPASQAVDGDLASATAALRRGGAAAVSDQLAARLGASVGGTLTLPAPAGDARFQVAATTTNLGWAPGAVILSRADFERWWGTNAPTAVQVDLASDASADAVRSAVERALGPASALDVLTAAERESRINDSARQGLNRLGQISVMLLIAAVLAMAAATGAAIWQRRAALASLRIQSFTTRQLWRILVLESTIVLGAGCLTGALIGIYGQFGIDRYLRFVTGFPVSANPAGWQTVETFGLVVVAALAIVAIPGWFATRVPPRLGLQE